MPDKVVLIGSSLHAESDAVVRVGLAWARAAGARVHVAHAFAPPLGYVSAVRIATEMFLEMEAQRGREALARQVERVGIAPDELAGQTVRSGPAHRVLCELAAEAGAGLVILGAIDERFQRLLGSTADRVVRGAGRPVLIVRANSGDPAVPPARVLAPVDLSPLSGEALRTGLERLAELRGGAPGGPEIEALFVLSPIQRQVSPQFTPEQVDRFAADELERFVATHVGGAAGRVRCAVRVGTPREEILAEAEARKPDLILLGTHGLGGVDRFVIGSVAADVVREAPCSVMVIPPRVSGQS